eukprot:1190560-Prorocentrum_minimum.AAC.1
MTWRLAGESSSIRVTTAGGCSCASHLRCRGRTGCEPVYLPIRAISCTCAPSPPPVYLPYTSTPTYPGYQLHLCPLPTSCLPPVYQYTYLSRLSAAPAPPPHLLYTSRIPVHPRIWAISCICAPSPPPVYLPYTSTPTYLGYQLHLRLLPTSCIPPVYQYVVTVQERFGHSLAHPPDWPTIAKSQVGAAARVTTLGSAGGSSTGMLFTFFSILFGHRSSAPCGTVAHVHCQNSKGPLFCIRKTLRMFHGGYKRWVEPA